MTLLCLETSTKVCSVAIGKNGTLLALKESADEKYSHAENLTLFIEEACRHAKISLKDIDAVAVSKGPGSFTGLRIGVSAAKGLCYALDKPLIAVNSLEGMAASQVPSPKSQVPSPKSQDRKLFCPMIDAKRMEVYCALYDENLKEVYPASAEVIDEQFLSKITPSQYPPKDGSRAKRGDSISAEGRIPSEAWGLNTQYYFFGDGAEKCKTQITGPNVTFIDNVNPSAQFMIPIAERYFSEKKFEDVAYFEPYYLKDFFTTAKKPA